MTASPRPGDTGGQGGRLLRAAGTVALSGAAAAGAVVLAGEPVSTAAARVSRGTQLSHLPLDLLVGCLAALALTCCALWLVAVTAATAVEAVTGCSLAAVRAVSPELVRRLVLIGCGAAVGTSVLSPAAATATDEAPPSAVRVSDAGELTGLALPDRAEGSAPALAAARPAPPRGTAKAALMSTASDESVTVTVALDDLHHAHRVRAGESLWSIAERLRPGAANAEIDALWRWIYRTNRGRIGPDPDLIVPGTSLRLDPPSPRGTDPHRKDAS